MSLMGHLSRIEVAQPHTVGVPANCAPAYQRTVPSQSVLIILPSSSDGQDVITSRLQTAISEWDLVWLCCGGPVALSSWWCREDGGNGPINFHTPPQDSPCQMSHLVCQLLHVSSPLHMLGSSESCSVSHLKVLNFQCPSRNC